MGTPAEFISQLRQLRQTLQNLPAPSNAVPAKEFGRPLSPAAQKFQDEQSQLRLTYNACHSRIAELLREFPDLARAAGVSDGTIAEDRIGLRWTRAYHDLMGKPYEWFGLSSALAIDKLIATANVVSPSFPADHFKEKYGLPPNTLNKARREGRLRGKKRGGRWFYPLDGVRVLWPDAFAEDDET
jgi:hypothetical protein